MPNHVKCRLKMDGLSSVQLFGKDERNEMYFDFNKIIPMPEELDMISGSVEDNAIKAYMKYHGNPALQKMMDAKSKWNILAGNYEISEEEISRCAESNNMTVDELIKAGERYCLNVFYHGFTTWYDWCCEYWGTKWNAYETNIVDEDTVEFCTAWSAPLPVVQQLSRMYPDKVVSIMWADEDRGCNTGEIAYQNGLVALDECGNVIMHNTPDNLSNEAYEIYVKLWGESPCISKDADGNWQRNDCETCHGCD